MRKIGIVILNYNSFSDTIELVEALQEQTIAREFFMVVVDNASLNNSYEELKPLEQQYASLVVLQTGDNLGYAKGNNYGLNYLDDQVDPEYVAILNNDVVLPHDCLEKLKERYAVLESPAIIAPLQLDLEGNKMRPYPLNRFRDDCMAMFHVFYPWTRKRALPFKDSSGCNAMKVDLVPGSFMFSRFDTFKQMRFFYPNTFLFVEERFVAYRAAERGLSNYVLLDETYVHAHSKTINSLHSKVSKYKMLYAGWVEYARVCRKHGRIKSVLLRCLVPLSLFEIKCVTFLRSLFQNSNNK